MLKRMLFNKKEDVASVPFRGLVDNKTGKDQYNTALAGLQELREIAWHKAIKYRFDPVIGKMHEDYLNALNLLIKECVA